MFKFIRNLVKFDIERMVSNKEFFRKYEKLRPHLNLKNLKKSMPGSLNGKAGLEYTSMLAFKFLLGNLLKKI